MPIVLLGYHQPEALVGGALKLNAEKARLVFAEMVAKPLGMTIERRRTAPSDRRLQHDPCHQGDISRARPRSARFRAVCLRRQRPAVRRRRWHRRSASVAWWCRRRPGCSHPSDCSTPTSSITTRAHCAACCAAPTSPRSTLPGTRSRARRKPSSAAEGFVGPGARVKRSAALHYKGQSYELVVPVPDGPIDDGMVAALETAFAAEHERTYGHRAGPTNRSSWYRSRWWASACASAACPNGSDPTGLSLRPRCRVRHGSAPRTDG